MIQALIGRWRFLQSLTATGSFLTCYGMIDPGDAATPVRITPQLVDKLTIQAVADIAHDTFLSGASAPAAGVERVRTQAAY